MAHSSDEVTGAPHVGAEEERYPAKTVVMEDQRFTVKAVYDYLRSKGKPVPTGKPQVVGHKVDISGLAKAAFEAGGKAQVSLYSPSLWFSDMKQFIFGWYSLTVFCRSVFLKHVVVVFQFESEGGFQQFILVHFQLETAPERDKERALERLKKLYDQILADYVEELVAASHVG